MHVNSGDILQKAHDHFQRGAWRDSFAAYESADSAVLGPADLRFFAVSATMVGETVRSDDSWELAYQKFLDAGQPRDASNCAFWLGFGLMQRGEVSRAGGWLGRAETCLKEADPDCPERGYLHLPGALRALDENRASDAHEIFSNMRNIALDHGDHNLEVMANLGIGQSFIQMGRISDGVRQFDALMVDITLEKNVSPLVIGIVYCAVVERCQELFEVSRAQEWTDALNSWCDSQQGLVPFRGQCLVHQSELLQFRGAWNDAMKQAVLSRDRLSEPENQPAVGKAFYQLGDLYRLRGEFDAAEANYRKASEFGHTTAPGLALLRSAQGNHSAAVASIQRSLGEAGSDSVKARLLLAATDIFLKGGASDAAKDAATELELIASGQGAPMLQALSNRATGAVLLAAGDPHGALSKLRLSETVMNLYPAAYERAVLKTLIGQACALLGDEDTASIEIDGARKVFKELNALPDIAALESSMPGREPGEANHPLTEREVDVVRLVAAGMSNRAIAQELVISEKTVARHLSNIFVKLDISSRAAATAYAYEHRIAGS